jgi:uncharacterized protein YdaU (DUF1376 family)
MKAPAFQTYAADYYMDTAHWTIDEVGIYQRLLLFEWVNGPLPDDEKRLARIAGCSVKKFQKGWTTISVKFILFGTCQLQNKRLEQTREIQHKYSESRRNNVSTRYKEKPTYVDTHEEHMSYIDSTLLSSSSSSIKKDLNTIVPSSAKQTKRTPAWYIKYDRELKIFTGIKPEDITLWKSHCPHIDVEWHIKDMEVKIDSNGYYKSNWKKFIVNWLTRAQDKARVINPIISGNPADVTADKINEIWEKRQHGKD